MKLFVKDKCDVNETEVIIRCQTRDEEVENIITGVHNATKRIIGVKEKIGPAQCASPIVFYLIVIAPSAVNVPSKESLPIDTKFFASPFAFNKYKSFVGSKS